MYCLSSEMSRIQFRQQLKEARRFLHGHACKVKREKPMGFSRLAGFCRQTAVHDYLAWEISTYSDQKAHG